MTDQELIETLRSKALFIMNRKEDELDPLARANALQKAWRYIVCCAVLQEEYKFDELSKALNTITLQQPSIQSL